MVTGQHSMCTAAISRVREEKKGLRHSMHDDVVSLTMCYQHHVHCH